MTRWYLDDNAPEFGYSYGTSPGEIVNAAGPTQYLKCDQTHHVLRAETRNPDSCKIVILLNSTEEIFYRAAPGQCQLDIE